MSDDMTPAQIDAEKVETIVVSYNGADLTFPASMEDADGDVIDAIDDQKVSHALRGLLGDDEWARFKATKPKVRDYEGLFTAYAAAIGLESAEK